MDSSGLSALSALSALSGLSGLSALSSLTALSALSALSALTVAEERPHAELHNALTRAEAAAEVSLWLGAQLVPRRQPLPPMLSPAWLSADQRSFSKCIAAGQHTGCRTAGGMTAGQLGRTCKLSGQLRRLAMITAGTIPTAFSCITKKHYSIHLPPALCCMRLPAAVSAVVLPPQHQQTTFGAPLFLLHTCSHTAPFRPFPAPLCGESIYL